MCSKMARGWYFLTTNIDDYYKGRWINKLQNCVLWLIFKITKIQNIPVVGNLFFIHTEIFFNNDVTSA